MYVLSACGGFHFSRKSVARGALHLFCQNAPSPQKKQNCPVGEAPIGLLVKNVILIPSMAALSSPSEEAPGGGVCSSIKTMPL